jgi:HPt (histidine-containing phosphotransfer) domain-containing protein
LRAADTLREQPAGSKVRVLASTMVAKIGGSRWRVSATAIGLSIAAVTSPGAVVAAAATGEPLWPPVAAGALVALLLLASLAVALAAFRVEPRPAGAAVPSASRDTELAAARVLVFSAMFVAAVLLAVAGEPKAALVAAATTGLIAAWGLLLCVMLWPAVSPLRRLGMLVLDAGLVSAYLHFGDRSVIGWLLFLPLLIVYAAARFGSASLITAAIASVLGFAAVAASTDVWAQRPTLVAGLLLVLVAVAIAATIRLHLFTRLPLLTDDNGRNDRSVEAPEGAAARSAAPLTAGPGEAAGPGEVAGPLVMFEPEPVAIPMTPVAPPAEELAVNIDLRVIEGLRRLTGSEAALRDIVETFRRDARQTLEALERAVAVADRARFSRSLAALHRSAGQLGGVELCALATALRNLSESELQLQGALHVEHLRTESERLATALTEALSVVEADHV